MRALASLAVVFLAFWIAAYLPFADSGDRREAKRASPQRDNLAQLDGPQTFATRDLPVLSGYVQSDIGQGFSMEEVVVAGPCLGAGQRYLESVCPQCVVTDSEGPEQSPAVLFWVEGSVDAPTAGAIFKDCSEEVSPSEVLVPTLTVGEDPWLDASNSEHPNAVELLPLPVVTSPLSVFTLGSWEIAEYDISHEADVAGRITDWLLARNWTLPGEQTISDSAEQLVYVSEGEGMLVLTFNEGSEGKTLIAMRNKAGD